MNRKQTLIVLALAACAAGMTYDVLRAGVIEGRRRRARDAAAALDEARAIRWERAALDLYALIQGPVGQSEARSRADKIFADAPTVRT